MKVKPLLRWAGGKQWLANDITNWIPEEYVNYYELFTGGASVFTRLKTLGLLNGEVILSDINDKLINFYKVLKSNPRDLIGILSEFENNKEYYYNERSRDREDRIEKAAQFYYLNRTSFNGIYRENLKGEYNVPYGYKKYKELFSSDHIYLLSEYFKDVKLKSKDFEMFENDISENDFLFLDPPYTVAHNNNGFVKYNQRIFKWEDQIRLSRYVSRLTNKGVKVMMTNANHETVKNLYNSSNFTIHEVDRASLVGGKNAKRGKYTELIIQNY